MQIDGAAVTIVVANVGNARPNFCVNPQLFLEFASKGLFRTFALFDLAAGKLPLQRHRLIGTALADQDKALANQQPCNDEAERGSQWSRVGDGLRFFHVSSVNALQQGPM